VAKIERRDGVDRLAEIVDAADGICVARGDLGIEVPIGEVPGIQREASRLCRAAGKFVMNGGQLLASMVANPVPLRAEVSDLATVVRDDLDAIVLSDETAAGAYPVEAVRISAHVLELTERYEAGAVIGGSHPDPLIIQTTSPQKANWLSTWRGVFPVLSSPGASPDAVRIAAGVAYPGLGDTSALKVVSDPTD
jgi:pyruvate kinase